MDAGVTMPTLRKPRWVWLMLLAIPLAALLYYPLLPEQIDSWPGTTLRGQDLTPKNQMVLVFSCQAGLIWLVLLALGWIAGRFSERLAQWCWQLNGALLFCLLYAQVDVLEGNRVQRDAFWPDVAFAVISTTYVVGKVRPLLFRKLPEGHCRKCGYNLTGNVSGICSECGTPIPKSGDVRADTVQ